jgi:predicted exporter
LSSARAALAWLLIVLAVAGWLAWRLGQGPAIDADLLGLLPEPAQKPALDDAAKRFRERFERRLLLLVAAPEAGEARAAAGRLQEQLEASGLFAEVRLRYGDGDVEQIGALYFPHRFRLLSERSRAQMRAGDREAFEQDLLRRYFSPMPTMTSALVGRDPLLLLTNFLAERVGAGHGRLAVEDGYLSARADGRTIVVVSAMLVDTPFSFTLQARAAPLIARLRDDLPQRFPGTELLVAGVLLHAIAGTERARREISIVGLGSLVGIVVLFLVVFRSWRPLGLGLAMIGIGCLAGFAACLAVFGRIHLLTLVFGASLVGIAVDYALHYFCEGFRLRAAWSAEAALRHVRAGITLCLITTIIGFAGLLLAPFPGLRQMAVFSGAGLVAAYLSVVTCYPLATQRPPMRHDPPLLALIAGYAGLWRGRFGRRQATLGVLVAALMLIGCLRLEARDDLRLLQALDPTVAAEAARVQGLLGQTPASQFFLVEGRDVGEVLAREEALAVRLGDLQRRGELAGHRALADVLPSPARQVENRALVGSLLENDPARLQRLADAIGLDDRLMQDYVAAFGEAAGTPPLAFEEWRESALARAYTDLWPSVHGDRVVAAVALEGVQDLPALQAIGASADGVHLIDEVGALSALFAEHRRSTVALTLAACVAVTGLLQSRYGLRGGLLAMAPPFAAAFVSLGVLGLLGEPISLFNIMALLLVLGFGVDYALFFRETGIESDTTLLAIALSAITTILAFGLLAFSATAAIHAFGLTITIGIATAFLLSPLAGLGVAERRP